MLIRFWFGAINIGRPSRIGYDGDYDCAITWCWGRKNYDVPPGELRWRFIRRWAWDWMPMCIYHIEPRPLTRSEAITNNLIAAISGKEPVLLAAEQARLTERAPRFVGFGDWRHATTTYRSIWRSKMYVYLTGAKERANPKHILRVCPGAIEKRENCPSDWFEGDTPKPFEIEFVHGRASVDERLGEWMIAFGQVHRTNLVRASASTLGSLAATIAGRR